MTHALIYSPGFDGHRQLYVFVLSQILSELGYFVHIAGNKSQIVSNTFYINEVEGWPNVEIIDTSEFAEGGLGITHLQFIELQNRLKIDLTILPEADHHLELLLSQWPKGRKAFRGRIYGIFLRPFYFYRQLGSFDKLRYLKHLPSRWKKDDRLFHEFLLDRLSLLDGALYLDENYVRHHPGRIWIPDMFQQYADSIIQKSDSGQKQWIEKLEGFMKGNEGRFVYLYFGTAQSRRGFDIIMNLAEKNEGCFIHCGLRNDKERFDYDLDKLRKSLDKKGALLETNQFIEDPVCVEAFFKAATHLILPYRDFYGSSGVMLQALSYGIPVLSPNRGIIGHRIEKYGLGLTYDDRDPEDFYVRLDLFINQAPQSYKEKIESYMSYQTSSNLVRSLKEILAGNTESVKLPNQ
jgi:glycosyltransferase involved in cell wall biosynthesis